ncbi:MAG: hypothetical protein ACE5KA_00050 [Nitrososphaerales archaeon]
MDYNNLCSEILKRDPNIRYAGICDMTGEIRYDLQREGVKNLLTHEEEKLSLSQAVYRWSTRKFLQGKTGRAKYAMAEYEKMKRITMPVDDNHIILVTTEVSADVKKIVDDILDLMAELK